MKTYNDAAALLPSDAKWSCSFGYPGEGGYSEHYRCPNGDKWIIRNGPWCGPVNWTCEKEIGR